LYLLFSSVRLNHTAWHTGALKLVVVKREEHARVQQRRQEQRHQEPHDVRDVIDDLIKAVVREERASAASAVAESAHADTASSAVLVEDNTSADIQEAAARKKDEAVIDTGARDPPVKIMSPSSDDTPQMPIATPVIRSEAAAPEIGNQFVALLNDATEHVLSFAGDARASRLYVLRAGPSGGGRAVDIEDAKGPAIRKMEGAVNDQVGCDANGLLALCDVCVQGR
jgi:hypothetical protein